jgi:predicted anti-sigma-YlaC factor YlaD
MTCEDAFVSLGAYALGTLDAADNAAVAEHLAVCAACRMGLQEVAGLPRLLSMLTVSDIAVLSDNDPSGFQAGDELYQRLAAVARDDPEPKQSRSARSHGQRVLSLAAAVVVMIGAITGVALWATHSSNQTTVFRATGGTGVTMAVGLDSQASGTALRVTVSGLHQDEQCWLYAIGSNGRREMVGQWTSTYKGEAQQTSSTNIPRGQLSQLVLVGTNHRTLVTVPL